MSNMPSHLQTALRRVAGYMQRGVSGEGQDGTTADYSALLRQHKAAALTYLAEQLEGLTQGSFTVREAEPSLFRGLASFNRTPILHLVVCRTSRRKGSQVSILGDDDELYFIPRRETEPTTGLVIRNVPRTRRS